MNIIEVDGKLIRKRGHDYLIEVFDFPIYYGSNLDALYDCLTDIATDTEIWLFNSEAISKDCLDTFKDAASINDSLSLKIEKEMI